jgi:outer membrane protein
VNSTFFKYILISIFSITSFQSFAQRAWTLEECVQHALENNLRLKQSRLQSQNQQATLTQLRMQRLPTVSANSSLSYNYGRSIDPFTNSYLQQAIQSNNVQLQATVNIFSGFQVVNNIKAGKMDAEVWKNDLKVSENDLALNVASFYLQILLAKELQEAAEVQVKLSEAQAERAKILFEAGRAAEGDYLQVEAQKANDVYTLTNAKNNVQLSYLNLWQLLDVNPDTLNSIAIPNTLELPTSYVPSADEIYNSTLLSRPEVMAATFRLHSAEYGLKSAQGGRYPRLLGFGNISSLYSSTRKDISNVTLVGFDPSGVVLRTQDTVYAPRFRYDTKTTPYAKQFNNNFGQAWGLSLQIPILNGWSVNTAIQRAKINIENANLNMKIVQNGLYKNIMQACLDLKAGSQKYQASKNSFEAQSKSFQFAKIKYDNGASNYTDYLLILTGKARAEANYIQAKYELAFKYKVVQFYEGKSLKL